jgi:hypothetical protein
MQITTETKLKYLQNLLKTKGCPVQDITPYALQILTDCDTNYKSVYDVELTGGKDIA